MVVITVLAILGGVREAAAQSTSLTEGQQARVQLNDVFQRVKAAIDQAGGDPRALVAALPPEVLQGNEHVYDVILALRPGETAAQFTSESPNDPVREAFKHQARAIARRYAPERDVRALEREALSAIAANGSVDWPYFKGHFLHPELPAPYGNFAPNCENHWCTPDLYISDYDETDLDGRPGNFCSVVPDFWFRWPCYQHDIAYAFAPMVADSKIGSFLGINWQWYGDMRTECHERIRFDWLNPEFVVCQAVAFTYWVGVNTFAFPIFNTPNEIKGYDVLTGEDPDLRRVPLYRRWNACTGRYTESRPFVSYNRSVFSNYAEVPQGAILELSGRTHRGTRILFEFVDDNNGNTVANHLTATAGDNCIIAQEPERFSTSALPVGLYTVKARYYAWEGSGQQVDWAYGPPRVVAYGTPTYNENVMKLNITAAGGSVGGGSGGGGDRGCEYSKAGCLAGEIYYR